MDLYQAGLGLLFVMVGALVLVIQYREGDFDTRSEITQNTVGLIFAGVLGIVGGIFLIINS